MKCTFAVWILFVAFYISTKDINAKIEAKAMRDMNIDVPENSFISCTCKDLEIEMRMPLEKLGELFMLRMNGTSFSHCSNCSAGIILCSSLDNSTSSCIKENWLDNNRQIDMDEASSARSRRDVDVSGPCNFPKNMKTSHLSCIKYPRALKCTQKCIFGHTLEEGITREMRCDHKDNVWKPKGFQECSPFVDCTVTLVATGNMSCKLGTPYTPSVCNVTCGDYEDKLGTPLTTYECQINGGWDQKLPHCAISGSGFALVPAPRVRVHALPEENEPKKKTKPQKNTEQPNLKSIPTLISKQKI